MCFVRFLIKGEKIKLTIDKTYDTFVVVNKSEGNNLGNFKKFFY